jgi:hypothetical protein
MDPSLLWMLTSVAERFGKAAAVVDVATVPDCGARGMGVPPSVVAYHVFRPT